MSTYYRLFFLFYDSLIQLPQQHDLVHFKYRASECFKPFLK